MTACSDSVPGFAEFHAELVADYAAPFADAAHLLRRLAAGEQLFAPAGARGAARASLTERAALTWPVLARAARSAWGQARNPDPLGAADVLMMHVPARSDYHALLVPVAAELEKRGTRVAHLAAGGGWHQAAGGAVAAARARYAAARGQEERFARSWGLDDGARRDLRTLLKVQAWDAVITGRALATTGARVGLAIHTNLDPGVLTAFREARVPLLLMQHGVFSGAWPEHDFLGASLLMTWGPYFSAELKKFPGPTPPTTVVGNPRLELLLKARQATGAAADAGVVYFGTNYDESVDTRALRLAARALAGLPKGLVRYRPHPGESLAKYRALVAEGVVAGEQVVTGADSYDLLPAAGVVVGSQTTLLLEAAAIGVPAVQVLPEAAPVDWAARGLPHASTEGELRRTVATALAAPELAAGLVAAARPLAQSMFAGPRGAALRSARVVEAAITRALPVAAGAPAEAVPA